MTIRFTLECLITGIHRDRQNGVLIDERCGRNDLPYRQKVGINWVKITFAYARTVALHGAKQNRICGIASCIRRIRLCMCPKEGTAIILMIIKKIIRGKTKAGKGAREY